MTSRSALIAVLAALAACAPPSSSDWRQRTPWRAITVVAKPVSLDPAHPGPRRVGALIFRGGLELHAPADDGFGGWSDLWVGEEERVVAVSDSGRWLDARLKSDPETGAPIALTHVRVGLLRDGEGVRLKPHLLRDAEGVARLADGRFAVTFEHRTRVRTFDLDRQGPAAPAVRGPTLLGLEHLPRNTTLEAIAQMSDGRLLIGAERGEGGSTPLWFAPANAPEPVAPAARLRLPFAYGVSGMTRLPDGDFVALERVYAPVVGAHARLVRIDAHSLARGEIEETELASLGPPLRLDNFEGVAASALPDGGARLYLISDDNFAPTQRTLLYVFDLPPTRPRRASS